MLLNLEIIFLLRVFFLELEFYSHVLQSFFYSFENPEVIQNDFSIK